MRPLLTAIALLAAALLPARGVGAQDSPPAPVVQVGIDPPRVVVGQQATLHVTVLAPNYMTAPPEVPSFQLRNVVTRQLQSVNINDSRDGVAYAGVRLEFAIYPMEAGSYAISDQKVHVKYAAEPPATREVDVALPGVSFEAFVPEPASGLEPFVAASHLVAEQSIKRSSDQLKAGDAVTRTVTIRAEGTPAMLLPTQRFAAVKGLALYPTQPTLSDKTEGRTDVLTATRVDAATYMLEQPGEYELPAIDIGWWNAGSNQVEAIHLDAVPLKVAVNPAAEGGAGIDRTRRDWTWSGIIDMVADHWLFLLLAVPVIAGFAWAAPAAVRRTARAYRRRRQAYLQSEAFAFRRFRRAALRHDARAAYFSLLDWLAHVGGAASKNSLERFKAAAGDTDLGREIGAVENKLFARSHEHDRWSPRRLVRHVSIARRGLRQHARSHEASPLPRQLNPTGATIAPAHAGRKPAR
ncbi:BatD family protein [Bradyrhizobium liaoningense]|uniref:BatD family protein n=1 Tax=Bradyrhizobium liaoningense TaxID=43992 RepID=UPI001BA8892E|nr:BatD family protein [Bradyrhizobium liaoningense]MBR0819878.1 BatD family protein [Bradyrhizobium liaoningense]